VSVLPGSIHILTAISPLTYTLKAMRGAMLEGQSPSDLLGGSLGIVLIYAAIIIPLGTVLLSASFRYARARGSLSRF
jgi:ABC-type polysaccharide/polyol phosphate export permease